MQSMPCVSQWGREGSGMVLVRQSRGLRWSIVAYTHFEGDDDDLSISVWAEDPLSALAYGNVTLVSTS